MAKSISAEDYFQSMLNAWNKFIIMFSDGKSKRTIGVDVLLQFEEAIQLSDASVTGFHTIMLSMGSYTEKQVLGLFQDSKKRLLSFFVLFLVSGLESAHYEDSGDFQSAELNNIFDNSDLLDFALMNTLEYFGGYYEIISSDREFFKEAMKKAGGRARELLGSQKAFTKSTSEIFLKSGKSVFELGRMLYLNYEKVKTIRK